MNKRCLVVPAIVLACSVLAGCGQKGPLFLPGEAPESQTDGAVGIGQGNGAGDDSGQPQSSPVPVDEGSNGRSSDRSASPDRPSSPVGTP